MFASTARFTAKNLFPLIVLAGIALGQACNVVRWHRASVAKHFQELGLASKVVQLGSGTMHLFEGGRGIPLLLIHGFPMGALETWENQADAFVARFHLLTPDLFWFGASLPTDKAGMIPAAEQADATVELLRVANIEKAHVVGFSFGGYVALQLALRHPEVVDRLVLVDAAGLEPTEEERAIVQANFDGVDDICQMLIPKDAETLRRFLSKLFYRPRWLPLLVMRQLLEDEFWKNKEAKERICRRLTSGGMLGPDDLGTLRVPALVLWGRHDPLLLPSMGERMARAIPGARLVFLEESGHQPMLEEPDRFNQVVLDFLGEKP